MSSMTSYIISQKIGAHKHELTVDCQKLRENLTFPVKDISPVIAMFCLTGMSKARDNNAVMMVQPADGPSFGVAPYSTEKTRIKTRLQLALGKLNGFLRIFLTVHKPAFSKCFGNVDLQSLGVRLGAFLNTRSISIKILTEQSTCRHWRCYVAFLPTFGNHLDIKYKILSRGLWLFINSCRKGDILFGCRTP